MAVEHASATGGTFRKFATSPHAAMVLATFIFGANYVVGRAVVGDVPPYAMGFVRWMAATLILLPFTWSRVAADMAYLRANWKLLALAGCLMPFMGAGLTYVALTKTIAVNGGIVQTSLPIFIVLLSWIFLRDRLVARQALGAVVAIAGVFAIVLRGDPAALLNLRFNTGDLILVFCNLSLAGYAIAVKRLPGGLNPMTLLTAICVFGAVYHVPFLVVELAEGEVVRATAVSAMGLLFVAIFPSVVAIMCWNHAIAELGANRAGFYMYLVPVFSAVLAYTFLSETIEPYHLFGGALIVVGVTLSTQQRR